MNHANFIMFTLHAAELDKGEYSKTIIASGDRRFFIAPKNPNPSVNGKRIRLLRVAGIEIITDFCKEKADYSNRAFINVLKHQKNCVISLQDIPFLTTRLPHGGKNPIRIILDRRLRTPEASCAFPNGGAT